MKENVSGWFFSEHSVVITKSQCSIVALYSFSTLYYKILGAS